MSRGHTSAKAAGTTKLLLLEMPGNVKPYPVLWVWLSPWLTITVTVTVPWFNVIWITTKI